MFRLFLVLSFVVYANLFGQISTQNRETTQSLEESKNSVAIQLSQYDVVSPKKVKICLNMIVKNESHIIERCLNSVKDLVDCISICDTGSTDHTIDLIEQFMKTHQIPGKVHRHCWKDFGYNRTLSAKAAQQTLKELGFSLSETYLLLLDADMLLEIDPSFNKQPLIADHYLVLQKSPAITYYNTRLIRASLPWESIGVTHEYWNCKEPSIEQRLDTLKINDRLDGGSKSNKFERDIKLLTKGLNEEPSNCRYMFYLAQCYHSLRQFKEAIKWYKARIAIGGWFEEIWYSKVMIGEIYEDLECWDEALQWYLDAYESNPDRAEPLQKIATYYRKHKQNHLAYLFAKQGSRIPFPNNQLLFISHSAYDYQFDEEISIAAYYISAYKEEGFIAANRLSFKKDVPLHVRCQNNRNLLFYINPLPNTQFYTMQSEALDMNRSHSDVAKKDKENKIAKVFSSHNPKYDFSRLSDPMGPINMDEGYLTIVHEIVDVDDKPQTSIHRFVFLDNNFKIQKISLPFIFKYQGIENCQVMTFDSFKNQLVMVIRSGEENLNCMVNVDTVLSLLKPFP